MKYLIYLKVNYISCSLSYPLENLDDSRKNSIFHLKLMNTFTLVSLDLLFILDYIYNLKNERLADFNAEMQQL